MQNRPAIKFKWKYQSTWRNFHTLKCSNCCVCSVEIFPNKFNFNFSFNFTILAMCSLYRRVTDFRATNVTVLIDFWQIEFASHDRAASNYWDTDATTNTNTNKPANVMPITWTSLEFKYHLAETIEMKNDYTIYMNPQHKHVFAIWLAVELYTLYELIAVCGRLSAESAQLTKIDSLNCFVRDP